MEIGRGGMVDCGRTEDRVGDGHLVPGHGDAVEPHPLVTAANAPGVVDLIGGRGFDLSDEGGVGGGCGAGEGEGQAARRYAAAVAGSVAIGAGLEDAAELPAIADGKMGVATDLAAGEVIIGGDQRRLRERRILLRLY